MKQIFTVFQFTFKEGIRKKAFIISTILILIIIGALCLAASFFSGKEEPKEEKAKQETVEQTETCYYIDDAGIIKEAEQVLKEAFPNTKFVTGNASKEKTYKNEIKEDETKSLLVVKEKGGAPFLQVYTKDFMSGISSKEASEALNKVYIAQTMAKRGVDAETIAFSQSQIPFEAKIVGSMDLSGYMFGIVLTLLMFFAIYYYGYGVSMSVATEKTSRVMETLIVSAKPSKILIGKCLGMGVLGIVQFIIIIGFSALCYTTMIPEGMTIMGMTLSLSAFTPVTAVLIIIYFILGYSLYAVMNAMCGATVSKIEDLNSAMMPVMLIAIVSFYISYFAAIAAQGGGTLQSIAMYVPFCSPFIMPFKLLNSDVAASDVFISIGLLIASIVVIAYISIRIYSASVLHYGGKLKIKNFLKK